MNQLAAWRISLFQALLLVGCLSFAVASFARPSELVTALWHWSLFALLAFAVLAAVYRRGQPRAFWVGFAVFGWVFVATDHYAFFTGRGTAPALVDSVISGRLDSYYAERAEREAAELLRVAVADLEVDEQRAKIRRALADRTRTVQQRIRSRLAKNVVCTLTLIFALVGGCCGRWLCVTNQRTNTGENVEDRTSNVERTSKFE